MIKGTGSSQREDDTMFTEEIRVLEDKQRLPSKGELLKITPKRDGGLLRSNMRLSYKMICQKRQSFQSSFQRSMLLPDKLRSAYQHEVERHEMGANFTLNHLR